MTKIYIGAAMIFPVVMYGCDSGTIKRAEHWKFDAFELWCWRRHLRVPWTVRIKPVNPKENQHWLCIGRTDAEPTWYSGHLMWRTDSLEKTLMLGKIEGKRRRGQQRMKWLDSITNSKGREFESTPEDSEGQRSLLQSMQLQRAEHDLASEQQQNCILYATEQYSILTEAWL